MFRCIRHVFGYSNDHYRRLLMDSKSNRLHLLPAFSNLPIADKYTGVGLVRLNSAKLGEVGQKMEQAIG